MSNANKIYYYRLIHHIDATDIDVEDGESLQNLLDKFHSCVVEDINLGYLGDIELNDVNLDSNIEAEALKFVKICYMYYSESEFESQLQKLRDLISKI